MENHNNLTDEEIKNIMLSAKKVGLTDTIDLYLLDFIKHCFLENNQLNTNIENLKAAIGHIADNQIKKGVEDVIENLECVRQEYNEYLEDMQIFNAGCSPHRAAGRYANIGK